MVLLVLLRLPPRLATRVLTVLLAFEGSLIEMPNELLPQGKMMGQRKPKKTTKMWPWPRKRRGSNFPASSRLLIAQLEF